MRQKPDKQTPYDQFNIEIRKNPQRGYFCGCGERNREQRKMD